METKLNKGNPWALLPLLVFLSLFIGTALITKDFGKMPVIVAFVIAGAVALSMNRKRKFADKVEDFARGGGHPNIHANGTHLYTGRRICICRKRDGRR